MGFWDFLRGRSSLPSWARWETANQIVVDVNAAYPLYLEKLAPLLNGAEPDQYRLEVARRCVTLDLKRIVKKAQRSRMAPLNLRLWSEGKKFALRNFPVGLGADRGAADGPGWWAKLAEREK